MAIVGIGCRFPGGASGPARYWDLLLAGTDAVTEIPRDRFDVDALYDPRPGAKAAIYTRHGAFVELARAFDAEFFGISPREARHIDPQQRLLLEVVWEALEDAGCPPDGLAGSRTGVFVGISSHDHATSQFNPAVREAIDAYVPTGGAVSIAANRLSYLLDVRGPSLAVDTACSSSLTALHLACRSLAARECDMALVGGVNVLLAPEVWIGFCKAGLLSRSGRCRPFDRDADGYVRGEGAGCVVLRPLEQALSSRDRIHAVIRATAVNQDGRTVGISMPNAEAQAELIREALAAAGVQPAQVHYVEAHGTGTAAGDPTEATAIGRVIAAGRPAGEPCLIGSVKGNVGHLEAAAGLAGLIKTALALEHRQVPATLGHVAPSPAIAWRELALRVPTAPEPWPGLSPPAIACVNSFGFGGANAHAVLEAPPERDAGVADDGRPRVALLSARCPAALEALREEWVRMLESDPERSLRDVCYTAALRRSHHRHRLAVVAATCEELTERLSGYRGGADTRAVVAGAARLGGSPRVAFVFSGMGSERASMGRELMELEPVVQRSLLQSDRILRRLAGWSLMAALTDDGAAPGLERPDVAQAANVALQIALAGLWRSWGVEPGALVGHSTGEASAACVAGALTLEEALLVSHHRGRLQQRLAGTGGMLAVGLSAERVGEFVDGDGREVSLAAVNAPSLVTLSGGRDALARIEAELVDRGIFCRPVPVDVPYHSPQLDGLRDELLTSLAGLDSRPPAVPIVSTVTGNWMGSRKFDARHWWGTVREPVRFAQAVERLADDRFECFIEVGAHPVLASALRDCLSEPGRDRAVLPTLRRGESEPETMLRSLAFLHVRGAAVDWAAALGPDGQIVDLPSYPWQRTRHWVEAARPKPAAAVPGRAAGDPLLGRRLNAARPTWEADLADERLGFLLDHVVGGVAAFPATGYLAVALAAVRALGHATPTLRHVELVRLLSLLPDTMPVLQCGVDEGLGSLEIHATAGADEWTLHARAGLGTRPAPAEPVDVGELRLRCPAVVRTGALYHAAARRADTRYGPAFRGVVALWRGRREAIARIEAPSELDLDGQAVHPALLDAAFQVAAAAVNGGVRTPGGPVLPVGVDGVEQHGALPSGFWAHAAVKEEETGFVADIRALDDEGRLLIRCEGLRLQVLGGRRGSPGSNWLYREEWQPVSPSPEAAREALSAPAIAASARPAVQQALSRVRLRDYYERAEPLLSQLSNFYAAEALAEIGWSPAEHSSMPLADAAAELGVDARRLRLWRRLATMASAAGDAAPCQQDVDELLAEHPDCEAMFRLVHEGGSRLPATLRGEEDARQWLFSGDPWATLIRVYAESPPQRAANLISAHAVAEAARGAGPLRILEVGAGTCATTGAILDALDEPPAAYLVTDISPLLVRRARQKLNRVGVLFATLDVERPPADHLGAFDVVVAANVVHATADLRMTLHNLRTLLAPGGMLVLQELTRPSTWLDLVFGQLEGWWLARDDIRDEHPLVTDAKWRAALTEAGFDTIELVADEPSDGGEPAETVFLAGVAAPSRPASTPSDRSWLVLADQARVAEQVAAALERAGARVTLVRPASEPGLDAACRRIRPTDVSDWQALLHAEGPVHGVVHLWSLDAPSGCALDGTSLLDAQELICGSLVALGRAARATDSLAEVWIVTEGAHSVAPSDETSVVQAPVWGVGRVLRNERPDLRVELVDLGSTASSGDVAALLRKLTARSWPGRSSDTAIRGGDLLAPRLVRAPIKAAALPAASELSPDEGCFRLEADSVGSFSFSIRAVPRCAPGPGEVEILVAASALNFRDVLCVLGVLGSPHGSPALGGECAGRVLACGEGVEHVAPDDEVIALGWNSFGSRLVARAELVVRVPSGLTSEEAATLPGAFGTAVQALRHVARVQPGERVLIHSAAGGVGLAAVQVAREAGAEIFATASTDEKRAYLSSVGVDHVMDSRSLAFAEEVMDLTGGEGVDIVLNSLAGEALKRSVELLRTGGRFLELGKRDIERNAPLGLRPFRRGLAFATVSLDALSEQKPEEVGRLLQEIVDEVEHGRMEPLPHTLFDLADAEHAFRLMTQAGHIGRILLTVDRPTYPVEGAAGLTLRPDRTYLVAGGLGGLGLNFACHLAERGARHLALVSRGGAPDTEEAALVEGLRAAGVTVLTASCDVARPEDVTEILCRVRASMPPLAGVVHSAMVLDDVVIEQLDLTRLRAVLAPKVAGAWNLHTLTRRDDLDFLLFFSSFSAQLAIPGQASYAAANTFLDALAAHRRALGLPALAVGLGAVSDAGHVARHGAIVANLGRIGVEALPPDDLWEVVDALLATGTDRAMLASIDWEALATGSGAALAITHSPPPDDGGEDEPLDEDPGDLRAELVVLSPADRPQAVVRLLSARVARVLEASPEQLDPERPLIELGLDSLMAVELMAMIQQDVGIRVALGDLLDGMTLRDLATTTLRQFGPVPSPA